MFVSTVFFHRERVRRHGALPHEPSDAGEARAREGALPGRFQSGPRRPGGHAEGKLVVLAVAQRLANRAPRRRGRAFATRAGAAPSGVSAARSFASPSLTSIIERTSRRGRATRPRQAAAGRNGGGRSPGCRRATPSRRSSRPHARPCASGCGPSPPPPGQASRQIRRAAAPRRRRRSEPRSAGSPGRGPGRIPRATGATPAVEGEGDDGRAGAAAHGGDVAQVSLEELRAHRVAARRRSSKWTPWTTGSTVRSSRPRRRPGPGAVVADPARRGRRGAPEPAPDEADQLLLAHRGDRAARRSERIRRALMSQHLQRCRIVMFRLNSACATIVVPMVPVRS